MDEQFTFAPNDFEFASRAETIKDNKPKTKPVGYFRDAWRRFKKNKASIVALCIIVALMLFAIFTPIFSAFKMAFSDSVYSNRLPKSGALAHIGIATGTYDKEVNTRALEYYSAIGVGASYDRATDSENRDEAIGGKYSAIRKVKGDVADNRKKVVMDSYYEIGFRYVSVTAEEYAAIAEYEKNTGETVLYPMLNSTDQSDKDAANYWYKLDERNRAVLDSAGNYVDDYMRDAEGKVRYSLNRDANGLSIRVLYYKYFIFKNGVKPEFLFGTNQVGQDILVRLACGIRLSLLLSFGVSAINLVIGAIYGTIEGYYGGTTDLIMEHSRRDSVPASPRKKRGRSRFAAVLVHSHRLDRNGAACTYAVLSVQKSGIRACGAHARRGRRPAYVQAYFPQHARHDYHLVRSRYPQRYFLRVHAVLPRHCQPRRHHDHEYRRNALGRADGSFRFPARDSVPRTRHFAAYDLVQPVRKRTPRRFQPVATRSR